MEEASLPYAIDPAAIDEDDCEKDDPDADAEAKVDATDLDGGAGYVIGPEGRNVEADAEADVDAEDVGPGPAL